MLGKQGDVVDTPWMTLIGIVLAAIALWFWLSNYGSQLGILGGLSKSEQNSEFNTLNIEIGRLLGKTEPFISTELSLAIRRGSAIVAFNMDDNVVYYMKGSRKDKPIYRPDYYCKPGLSCVCVYWGKDAWGSERSRNKQVSCKEYGANVVFYSRQDDRDVNRGDRLRTDTAVSGHSNYEHLLLDGRGFGERAMYLEKQKLRSKNYVYLAELDPHEEDSRGRAS